MQYYHELKDQIKPFDAILFRDDDYISELIAILQKYQLNKNTFTHIGLVVTADILPYCKINDDIVYLDKDKLYVLESTFSYTVPGITKCVADISGKGKFGVQLRELEKVIHCYIDSEQTKVAWCKLRNNPYPREDLQEKFMAFFEDYYNRPYEMNLLGLFSSLFPILRPLRDTRDYMINKIWKRLNKQEKDIPIVNMQFCSELVANVWNLIGVFNVNAKDFVPMDVFGDDIDHIERIVDEPIYFKII